MTDWFRKIMDVDRKFDQKTLWETGNNNWEIQERTFVPLYDAIIHATQFPDKGSVLDIGCGNGYFLAMLADKDLNLTGLDISKKAIDAASRILPEARFFLGEMEDLSFVNDQYDLIVFNNSLQYSKNIQRAILEAGRVLNEAGQLVIAFWSDPLRCDSYSYFKVFFQATGKNEADAIPFNLWRPGKIEKILGKSGFEVITRTEVICPRKYPDVEMALDGMLSSGPAREAVLSSGYDEIRKDVEESIQPFMMEDGTCYMENSFSFVLAEKQDQTGKN